MTHARPGRRATPAALVAGALAGLSLLVPVGHSGAAGLPQPPRPPTVTAPMPCARTVASDPATASALAALVTPPKLSGAVPRGAAADSLRRILALADRHALGTQFSVAYAPRLTPYADLRRDAWGVRAPTSTALGLAVSTETGAYDAAVVGRPIEQARAVAVWLTRSVACTHRAVTPSGWGASWQSPYYAAQLGTAGWLLWPHLSVVDRALVTSMVLYEADRLMTYTVPYYASRDGRVRFAGDTKAEENAWHATVLSLASAMMPNHPHRPAWMHKNAELLLSSYATQRDTTSGQVVNGAPLRSWLRGWNAFSDGTVVNHRLIHPDYMATISWNAAAPVTFGLAGQPTPRAAFHNVGLVYRALQQRAFASPPFRAPGGTMYVRGSGAIYHPQGNDWGYQRVVHFILMDVTASLFGAAGPDGKWGAAWQRLHADRQLALQRRTDDGRTFLAAAENRMPDPEQWIFEYAARSWLTAWVAANHRVRISDENLSAIPPEVQALTTVSGTAASPPPVPRTPPLPGVPPSPADDLPVPPVRLDTGFPQPPAPAAPEVIGDAISLDDAARVPDGRGDLEAGLVTAGANPRAVLTLAAPPAASDALTIFMNLYDARGAARYAVLLASAPGGALRGSVVRVGDGRRVCAVSVPRAVSGRAVSFALPRGCATGTARASLSLVTTIAGAAGGRAVVADVLGG